MKIAQRIKEIMISTPQNTKLIAVSKTKPQDAIMEAYNAGQKSFGENRVQEMVEKYKALPKDIQWHFIGHLQTNKVKNIVPFVHLIHSIDSLKLLQEVNKEASKINKVCSCLLQIYIASEETKFGFSEKEVMEMLESESYKNLRNIQICGLMGMASFTNQESVVRAEFKALKNLFEKVKSNNFDSSESFKELSMGMSGDYKIAIEEGSTMIRLGSSIFGQR